MVKTPLIQIVRRYMTRLSYCRVSGGHYCFGIDSSQVLDFSGPTAASVVVPKQKMNNNAPPTLAVCVCINTLFPPDVAVFS